MNLKNTAEPHPVFDHFVLIIIIGALVIRIFTAMFFPVTNDEAYYWDWGRNLELSYLDHPPFVAWLAAGSSSLANGYLAVRFFSILIKLMADIFMLLSAWELAKLFGYSRLETQATLVRMAIILQVVPYLHFIGFTLLPDGGLNLGMSIAWFGIMRLWVAEKSLALSAIAMGLGWGVAGLSKYHAAPLAFFMSMSFFIVDGKNRNWKKIGCFLGAFLISVLLTLPVWKWNYEHSAASFVFQASHGLHGSTLNVMRGMRVLLASFLMASPWVFVVMIKRAGNWISQSLLERFLIFSALPFIGLMATTLFFKPGLPHWILPGIVPLIFLVVLRPFPKFFSAMPHKLFIYFFAVLAPFELSSNWLNSSVKILSKPTWELRFASVLAAELYRNKTELSKEFSVCQSLPLGATRWFWTAQLGFHLPGQPKLFNLDGQRRSSYFYTRPLEPFIGRDVCILADPRHVDEKMLHEVMNIDFFKTFELEGESQQQFVTLVRGKIEDLRPWYRRLDERGFKY